MTEYKRRVGISLEQRALGVPDELRVRADTGSRGAQIFASRQGSVLNDYPDDVTDLERAELAIKALELNGGVPLDEPLPPASWVTAADYKRDVRRALGRWYKALQREAEQVAAERAKKSERVELANRLRQAYVHDEVSWEQLNPRTRERWLNVADATREGSDGD